MKQRRKILLALLLSASVATTPVASIPVLAEDLDIASEEIAVESEEDDTDVTDDSNVTDDSVLADDAESADLTVEEDVAEDTDADMDSTSTNLFSDGEVDEFSADGVSAQDATEAKTHSIKVTVVNSEGVASGMYAMDDAIVTKQDDGTYLVKMHQANENRNYMALVNGTTADDIAAATHHKVDWYVADSSYYYTIPVKSLSDTVYASFSRTANVNKGSKWGNVQTITFDTTSMADTDKSDVDASGMNKQAALDYSAVDTALATVPKDLSIYTDETAQAVTSAVNALNGTYKATTQADIDKLATAITDAVNALIEKGLLSVTNQTSMFNVEKAVLRDNKLIVTLHGSGYHYLYKGTYEEAVANDDNRENWIAGEEINGKWQFTIPVAEGEIYLPIVAISNKYLTKYEQGKNTLERAFYPRQLVINQSDSTLVSGDYNHTKDLTVDNRVKMFKVAAASLETIGGPNSNGYKETLHLTMGSGSFDKIYIGSAADAANAKNTTAITECKADLVVKEHAMGGAATTDYLEKEVTFSFHSVKNDTWYERTFNISKTNGTLTVTIPATGIVLNTTSQKLEAGKSFQVTATVEPSNTTDKVTWSSSNEAVAKVADDGTVTAVKAGTAVITATAGNVKTECTITVTAPATKITLNTTRQKLKAGKSFTLKATVAPADTTDKVVWSSNNTKVATVSSNGTVKALKAGTAVITVKAGNVKATCTVTVANPVVKVSGVKLAATPSRSIAAGRRVQLKATVAPSNATNKGVTWTSSNKKVATVNANGVVTFNKKAGGKKVVITAKAKDGSKKYAKITLTCMKGSVKRIKLSGTTTVKAGKTTKVKATVTTQNGKANKSVVWTSSNTKLATVDRYGKVKTVKGKKGTVTITAKAIDGSGKKATIKIRIK